MAGKPPDQSADPQTPAKSYAQITAGRDISTSKKSGWFKLQPIAMAIRTPVYIDNTQACIVSAMEVAEAAKQFEHALVLKFTVGRPSLQDIRSHIICNWKLEAVPVITLIDPRHVLVIAENEKDMITIQSQESRRIQSSLFRVFRWTTDFNFSRDSPKVPVWVSIPKLPIYYMNPTVLEKIGNIIGKFIKVDDRTMVMENGIRARICVEVDLSKPFQTHVFIGEDKDRGYWQKIDYEGNNTYCSHCGLLGHVRGICRKYRSESGKEKVQAQETGQAKNSGGKGKNNNTQTKSLQENTITPHQNENQKSHLGPTFTIKPTSSPQKENRGETQEVPLEAGSVDLDLVGDSKAMEQEVEVFNRFGALQEDENIDEKDDNDDEDDDDKQQNKEVNIPDQPVEELNNSVMISEEMSKTVIIPSDDSENPLKKGDDDLMTEIQQQGLESEAYLSELLREEMGLQTNNLNMESILGIPEDEEGEGGSPQLSADKQNKGKEKISNAYSEEEDTIQQGVPKSLSCPNSEGEEEKLGRGKRKKTKNKGGITTYVKPSKEQGPSKRIS
ncbi:hypothetical protein CASFOL_024390 [Castilleja foliolosa]|uniref:DUF4283 domain-containing protein n=1 Tax=Castilleja foliolosa TaxID=1961234 RepID=A0ABD3CR91_9LAMI